MMIRELIEELENFEPDADVRLPSGNSVESIYRCPPEILSDNSSYPVIMLLETAPSSDPINAAKNFVNVG